MKETQAVEAFGAIAQKTRLRIVRSLVVAGAEGMAAGAIASDVGGSPSRISFHLTHLERTGLVESRREGRFVVYSAVFPALSELVAFLMHDCCQGHCDFCDRAIALFAQCRGRPGAARVSRDVPKRPDRAKIMRAKSGA